jgi:methylmalonyl-CoA mutase N-terminal domain/subunit
MGEEEAQKVELHEYNPNVAGQQIKKLKEIKRVRDTRTVTQKLKDLEKAAREKRNVMPYLITCIKEYATVGEMTKVFKEVFGEFKEPSIF